MVNDCQEHCERKQEQDEEFDWDFREFLLATAAAFAGEGAACSPVAAAPEMKPKTIAGEVPAGGLPEGFWKVESWI